jgi:RNA polymerase sigma factor (sigma-70 family)
MENRIESNTSKTRVSDDILWKSFREGDDACYEAIYRRYIGILFNYGMQISSNADFVQDAIQDLFVKLYTNRAGLNETVNLKFYLFTSLKHNMYNTLRREVEYECIENYQTSEIPDNTAERKVTEQLDQQELSNSIDSYFSELTSRQREVMYCRFVQDLSIEEISLLMDMNYQSVQNIIQRSIKRIKQNLV